jgi:hypothetical protein
MSTSRHACSLCAVCLMHAYTAGLNNTQQGKHTIHTTQCGPVSPVNTHTFVLQCLRGAASHAKARAHWHKPQREGAQRQHACQIVSGTAAASHARIRLHTTPLHQRLWQTKWCRSLHTNACFTSAALQLHPCVPKRLPQSPCTIQTHAHAPRTLGASLGAVVLSLAVCYLPAHEDLTCQPTHTDAPMHP